MGEDDPDEASGGQTGWLYALKKEEIIVQMSAHNLSTTGTLEELRKRFSEYIRGRGLPKNLPPTANPPPTATPPSIIINQAPTGVSTIALLDAVRKWGLSFDGQEARAVMFYERLEELRSAYGISDRQLLLALPELFRDRAMLWYRNVHASWKTWADAKAAFEAFFLPADYQENLEDQIRTRLQRPSEGIKDFQIDIQTLMRRQGKLTEMEQLNRMYKNLRPEYKLYIKRDEFTSVQDLIAKAVTYEQLQGAMNTNRTNRFTRLNDVAPPGPSRRTGEQTSLNATRPDDRLPNYNRRENCWRCGQRGHARFDCRRPSRKFCSGCGKLGIWSTDCCRKRSGNDNATGDN